MHIYIYNKTNSTPIVPAFNRQQITTTPRLRSALPKQTSCPKLPSRTPSTTRLHLCARQLSLPTLMRLTLPTLIRHSPAFHLRSSWPSSSASFLLLHSPCSSSMSASEVDLRRVAQQVHRQGHESRLWESSFLLGVPPTSPSGRPACWLERLHNMSLLLVLFQCAQMAASMLTPTQRLSDLGACRPRLSREHMHPGFG